MNFEIFATSKNSARQDRKSALAPLTADRRPRPATTLGRRERTVMPLLVRHGPCRCPGPGASSVEGPWGTVLVLPALAAPAAVSGAGEPPCYQPAEKRSKERPQHVE